MDGIVHTYKAHLVAKGYTETYGVDYEETFSPVADIRAIRILIAITAFYNYEIWQMDIKTAFLNGYLDEDIYMVLPEGFIDPKHPRKVCKLQRSVYILKKASRSWNKRFDEEIKRMDNSKRGYISMQQRLDLNKTQSASTNEEVKRMQNVPYASVVGPIMYAVRCNRPDVAFTQNITSHFFTDPKVRLHLKTQRNRTGKLQEKYSTAMFCYIAEYIFFKAPMGAVWIRTFYGFRGAPDTTIEDTIMFASILNQGKINLLKVHTDDNLADPFTKALPKGKLTQHARSMGLRLASSFMMGLPNSHDIQKMNIGLPQLTRISLYGSASLSESFLVILNKAANKDYFRSNYEACDITLAVNKEFVPSIVKE
ncbi:retrotransposon protein, putative, ty1-copia subclass [Tanacetum coccineum]